MKPKIVFEKQWSDEFQEEVLVPIEVNEFYEEETNGYGRNKEND